MPALQNVSAASRRIVATDRVPALSIALQKEFDTSFLFYDGSTGELLRSRNAREPRVSPPRETLAEILAVAANGKPRVSLKSTARYRLLLPIQELDGPLLIAIGDIPAIARSSHESRLEQARLQKWLKSVQSQLSFTGWPQSQSRNDNPHLDQLRTLLEASRELNDLLASPRILGESSTYPNRILERIAAVLAVETLIWAPAHGEEPLVIEGDHILSAEDCNDLANLLAKRPEWNVSEYLVLNDLRSCGLSARFPAIVNLLALSVDENEKGGCLIALNKIDTTTANRIPGSDGHEAGAGSLVTPPNHPITDRRQIAPFRRIDAAACMPFAALLALQSRGSRRQSHVQELFAGLIRSLTAAIDAKDSYTRGHSERVARVAVELGRELGLSDQALGDLYLAGLLHDVGKIGIPDSILCKCEPLTPEEIMLIRQHVSIGCRILEEFREISHLLPLVLHHHERYDGMGYPHGLSGEAIPVLARILAVADSYDAMNTSRSYRTALGRERIEQTLDQERNRQWDGNVVDAFFRARERIYGIHHRGVGDSVWFALKAFEERPSPGPVSPSSR